MSELEGINLKLDELRHTLSSHGERFQAGETRMAGIEFSVREMNASVKLLAAEKAQQNGRVGKLEDYKSEHVLMHARRDAADGARARLFSAGLSVPGFVWTCLGVISTALLLWKEFAR